MSSSEKKCRKYGKIGHIAVACRSKLKQVNEISDTYSYNDSFFMAAIDLCDAYGTDAWTVKLKLCNKLVTFKIDTEQVPQSIYNSFVVKPNLKQSNNLLQSPGGMLKCKGMFVAKTRHNNQEYHFRIPVLQGCHSACNLLGRSVAHSMGLVMKLEEVCDVCGTIGCVKGPPVRITLTKDAVPYCVIIARRFPFPIISKVEAELNRMETAGIIVKVTEPTDRCAPIVTAFKKR